MIKSRTCSRPQQPLRTHVAPPCLLCPPYGVRPLQDGCAGTGNWPLERTKANSPIELELRTMTEDAAHYGYGLIQSIGYDWHE